MSTEAVGRPHPFLADGGAMGALMRRCDWSATPLGDLSLWPQSLRTILSVCLNSPAVSTLYWGPEFRLLYNDAYAPMLEGRHPWALGRPLAEVWPDLWLVIGPQAKAVIETGQGYVAEHQRLVMERHGRPQETFWSYTFAPVRGETGTVAGILVTAMDTTAKTLGERRLAAERGHLMRLFEQAHGFMSMLRGPEHVFELTNPAYMQLVGHRDVVGKTVREALPEVEGQGFFELLDEVYTSGTAFRGTAMTVGLQRSPGVPVEERFVDIVYQPVTDASGAVTGIFVEGHDVTEMHLAQVALRESEKFNRRVLASSDDCIKVLDLDGRLTFMSEGGQRVMEVGDFNAIKGCPWPDFWQDQGNLDAQAAVAAARAGRSGQFQGHAKTMAGTPRFWDVRVTPIFDAEGRPEKILSISRDITATWRAEEALRQLNESLEQRVEERTRERDRAWKNSRDLQAVVDADGLFSAVNEAWTTILGWHPDEVIGKNHLDFNHPDDARASEAARKVAAAEGLPVYENRCRHKDGTYRWISWVATPEDGLIYASGRHITAERQRETELSERTAERDRLWTLSEDLLARADYGGMMSAVSPAWTRVLGWSEADLLSRPYGTLMHPDDMEPTLAALARMGDTTQPTRFENRIATTEGVWKPIEWTVAPEADGAHFIAVGRDLSIVKAREAELASAQDALRQSQKMEAVGQLTGGLAHDFNNLLAGISGSLELMQTRLQQGRLNDVERYMNAAQGAAKRAAALTHRLLAFSRRQTLDPKPTNVNRLVTGMQDLIQRTVGPAITFEFVGVSGLWPALVDPPQLENALLNLCINARDAMPDGGRITVETANKWLDARAARQHDIPEGQYLSLCVTDTGTGMSAEVIARVFEPFFTTKPMGEGTGLGLSMIYGFTQQSGGQVRIYSEVGEGTTVCLYLPRHYGEIGADEAPATVTVLPRSEQGETVLIVDDEPTVRMLVTDILDDLGYTAIEAGDSAAGLRLLQSDVRIDLLVTDVGLPGGMNGRQMADAGRVTRPDLKVLFITGYAENSVLGNGHLAPGMAVLTKPFAIEAMAARLRQMIEA